MKLRKQILFSAVLILSLMQSNTGNAQNLDTRKGYDLRGHGYDSAMRFVVRYSPQLPIIISISTTDDKFLEVLKQTFLEMDKQGYENITVVIHDIHPHIIDESHSVMFIKNGYPIVRIVKVGKDWGIVFIKGVKKESMEVIMLSKNEKQYPLTLIKTQVKMLYK